MKYAYVNTNVLDMRAQPDHQAERVNQALFGEPLILGGMRKGFTRVTQLDSYSGWVDSRQLMAINQKAYTRFRKAAPGRVLTECRLGSDRRLTDTAPHKLYYGTPIWIESSTNALTCIQVPDGRRFYIRTRCAGRYSGLSRLRPSGERVIKETRKFLGTPYLWGGVTPNGWDCSAMVRAIMARFGIDLPRDTKDQIKSGVKVSEDNINSGDLLFFDRHVGFAIGSDRLIHCSLGGGGVRINSLNPVDDDYREDLHESFKLARRVL